MDKQIRKLKKSPTSSDVEANTKPLQKAKRELEVSETSVKLKKHKGKYEDQNTSLEKVKEISKEKLEEVKECCFETEDAVGDNKKAIFVSGFNCSLTRDDVKTALKKHFRRCGKITRVFVPIECQTGSPMGFAFINLRKNGAEKAMTLDGSYLGGLKLEVTMAKGRPEYTGFPSFTGCGRCALILLKRRYDSYSMRHGGRIMPCGDLIPLSTSDSDS